ncbi:MAG: hypothetical protein TREMPRED_001673 [Tremellales sp. Tagirdzhanova-0007]|nr:MAG: hypothetical protein TREMPRED_001673 [Tremellales sp. Tagirdzhanova-0007]
MSQTISLLQNSTRVTDPSILLSAYDDNSDNDESRSHADSTVTHPASQSYTPTSALNHYDRNKVNLKRDWSKLGEKPISTSPTSPQIRETKEEVADKSQESSITWASGREFLTYMDGTIVASDDERHREGLPGGIERDKRQSKARRVSDEARSARRTRSRNESLFDGWVGEVMIPISDITWESFSLLSRYDLDEVQEMSREDQDCWHSEDRIRREAKLLTPTEFHDALSAKCGPNDDYALPFDLYTRSKATCEGLLGPWSELCTEMRAGGISLLLPKEQLDMINSSADPQPREKTKRERWRESCNHKISTSQDEYMYSSVPISSRTLDEMDESLSQESGSCTGLKRTKIMSGRFLNKENRYVRRKLRGIEIGGFLRLPSEVFRTEFPTLAAYPTRATAEEQSESVYGDWCEEMACFYPEPFEPSAMKLIFKDAQEKANFLSGKGIANALTDRDSSKSSQPTIDGGFEMHSSSNIGELPAAASAA